MFLLLTLAQGRDLGLERCPRCAGIYVRDIYAMPLARCPLCRVKQLSLDLRRDAPGPGTRGPGTEG